MQTVDGQAQPVEQPEGQPTETQEQPVEQPTETQEQPVEQPAETQVQPRSACGTARGAARRNAETAGRATL